MNIIPKPLSCKKNAGHAIIGSNCTVTVADTFGLAKSYLVKFISGLAAADKAATIAVLIDNKLSVEEYNLIVNEESVMIIASSEQGAMNGIKTLVQLSASGSIPCCEIKDKPQYSWRGFMLDCARHYWTVEYIKSTLDVMASLKLNVFHWHITDDQGWRVEIKKHPDLAIKGCKRSSSQLLPNRADTDGKEYGEGLYYTQEDIKSIVAYATTLGINVVPEIDMPGHLVAAVSVYPEISCEGKAVGVSNRWGVLDVIGCCGNEKLYSFIDDILDEICQMFPYDYFHIGGDEVPKTKWKNCPKCQAKIKELGLKNEEELQGYFNNYVAKYIKKYNKKLIGWNEVLHADNLDKDTIIQWWTPGGKSDCLKWINNGGKVILSKHQNFYMDHSYAVRPLKKTYGFNYKMLGIKSDDGVIGIEAPQWVEYISTIDKFEFNTYPRMFALADVAWTPVSGKNYTEFESRLEGLRELYKKKFNITMASQYFYRGKSVSAFMREAKGWVKWNNDPDNEIKRARAGEGK